MTIQLIEYEGLFGSAAARLNSELTDTKRWTILVRCGHACRRWLGFECCLCRGSLDDQLCQICTVRRPADGNGRKRAKSAQRARQFRRRNPAL